MRIVPPTRRTRDVAEMLRQAGVPVFLYGAGAEAAAEALEVLDVRQDDLVSGADPFAGKRQRTDANEGPQ